MAAPPPGFAIIAHRGDSDAAPENTFAAFDLALSRGFPAFETDAQLSADGAAVLLHCEELGRTCDGAGDVAGTSLDALKQLDAGSWFSPQFAGA
ncbi:glycerophosphoryl diesterphosphodiesterase [Monoraphidium neglectum]|uniref:glycerophosphodiester phosphodiesterase n=1 Tax=Monoraphidium neglectum TaxID=145388 RepID=A0A0D2LIW6_9CHLO|nr:glycerophosphoryl diesterphosphodiesterase [Monoraphidium neglectum]KIZ06404.1 glycerophosphoryl diesterphosphodiesterase [Monoraphidium neglectum]|eukprot:XP_013905423.1 glycerophosphoryl diesterphosphodiesterase [Monoraphidium neglectum]